MTKPIVFISHITEEKELAINLKELIEERFLGMIEVFVSSDENSISVGSKWLDNISDSLKVCVIELILCSPASVKRPWINFEAGAGWVRGIPVIPLCHSGMTPSNLPVPLNMLQAIQLNEVSGLKLMFPVLANAINARTPEIDLNNFIDLVIKFERRYTVGDNFKKLIDLLEFDQNQLKQLKVYSEQCPNNMKLDLGFRKMGVIEQIKSMESNQLKGMIKVTVENSEIRFSNTEGAINGGNIYLNIIDSKELQTVLETIN